MVLLSVCRLLILDVNHLKFRLQLLHHVMHFLLLDHECLASLHRIRVLLLARKCELLIFSLELLVFLLEFLALLFEIFIIYFVLLELIFELLKVHVKLLPFGSAIYKLLHDGFF